ncbi:(deoxy)nucleoside triphosphate pyrophosphohydrolase [Gordonia humi]|uniref:8-oxo-dGTP diphosphatase n=1 Tax=Gordonia humi TaxID=686429 RepID=A0A840FCT9_9ACTN|nr:(deoxy)nucleoside triphosphate pyrophosphohydrolase [Gordonia humi]MBB4137307.1 8-oxo-dGTP diphosphatase [Gordonia humi]
MSATTVVAGAILSDDGRILLAQRAYPPELAGLWELPGGKVEPGETLADALVRELCEELNVRVEVGDRLAVAVTLESGLELIALRATIVDGTPTAAEHRMIEWVDAERLRALDQAGAVVPNDREWLPEILADLLERG